MTNTPPNSTNSNAPKVNPIVIKKYANRRLYNTDTSSYVTLDDLCKMIKDGEEIIVFDAKNGDDITRSVLTQIIVEQEAKGGQSLLPTGFLRQIISYYGGNMQGLVPGYLDFAMQALTKNQGQMQEVFRNSFGSLFPFNTMQQMTKQNVALFEQTMRMFSPFAQGNQSQHPVGSAEAQAEQTAQAAQTTQPASPNAAPHLRSVQTAVQTGVQNTPAQENEEDEASIRLMQQRLDDLQKQIGALAKKDDE
ncbi:MAG: polyhydroxyalkanoate synthesis repressor PhaR [Alphaproteobacteria bacterium]|nr:polyhydroxyalkanoate synthesis repressor PhaR [Alphaproteobacteria bacterium]